MQRAADLIDANVGPDGLLRLAMQIWAEAARDPVIGALAKQVYTTLGSNYVRLAERAVERGELPPGTDPRDAGPALFSLMLGYGLQRILLGGPPHESYLAGLEAVLSGQPRPGCQPEL
jgi:hypothetical protein